MKHVQKLAKKYGALLLLTSGMAVAQTAPDPNTTVTGAAATAQASWAAFAAVSASAFVFAMVIAYGRKGRK